MLRRAAFFHVPKCAGTSVVEVCRRYATIDDVAQRRLPEARGRGHCLPRELPSHLWRGRLRFVVLRDPVDWYRSCLRYMTKRAGAGNDNVSFEDYGFWWGRWCDPVLHRARLAAGGRLAPFVDAIQEDWPGFLSDVYEAFTVDVDVVLRAGQRLGNPDPRRPPVDGQPDSRPRTEGGRALREGPPLKDHANRPPSGGQHSRPPCDSPRSGHGPFVEGVRVPRASRSRVEDRGHARGKRNEAAS